jgi:hypothetical protein
MFGLKKNKNVQVGMGASKNKDPYLAAKEAAKEAIKNLDKEATFSIVYTNSEFDQNLILKGINEILKDKWVGSSVDKQISSKYDYDKNLVVSVVSIYSEYLHFGIGISENCQKNPLKSGAKAIENAMKNAKADKQLDSFIQFTRIKRQDFSNIVKTPPYFIFTILPSQTKEDGKYISGHENEFLSGILQYTGPHLPVFGLGSGSDFDKFLDPNIKNANSYQFANGKLYTNAGVVVFVISDVHFDINVMHPYDITKDFLIVTKIDSTGFEILELNGKEPVNEYCRVLGIKKKDYLKEPEKYVMNRPFGLIALDNSTYIKEAFPNSDGKTLHSQFKLQLNSVLNVSKLNKKRLNNTMGELINSFEKSKKRKKISICLFNNCSSLRFLMNGSEKKVIENLIFFYDIPFFGCYTFSEIGSTSTNMAQVHGETVTSLIIYDDLLSN